MGLAWSAIFAEAGAEDMAAPTSAATRLPTVLCQICFRRRMRRSLLLPSRRCEGCGATLDYLSDDRTVETMSKAGNRHIGTQVRVQPEKRETEAFQVERRII